jgi:Co/Zn/Cd efflux system component
LHILADTLGSVGVIVSALLMQYFGWMIADPICSMIIAILIFISVGSLLKESTAILMQRQPKELDHKLPECYNKVCIYNFKIVNYQQQNIFILVQRLDQLIFERKKMRKTKFVKVSHFNYLMLIRKQHKVVKKSYLPLFSGEAQHILL